MMIDVNQLKESGAEGKVVEIYSTLRKYMSSSARNDWKELRDKCWKAISKNEMWEPSDEAKMRKTGQVPLVINKMNKGVQGSSAIVTDSKPEVKVYPIGSGDVYVAELLKRGIDLIWDKSKGSDRIYEGVEEAKIGGISFFHVMHDKSKGPFGRILFKAIKDSTNIYWDESSEEQDLSDSHIILAQLRSKEYIKERYPDITDDDLFYHKAVVEPLKSEGVTGADNYAEAQKNGRDDDIGDAPGDLRCIWEVFAWMLEVDQELWGEVVPAGAKDSEIVRIELKGKDTIDDFKKQFAGQMEVVKTFKRPIEKRVLYTIVGRKIIEKEENPFGVDADGDPVPAIVALVHDRTETAYPTCPSFRALEINKEKNKRRSQFIYAMSVASNAPIVRDKNSYWEGPRGQIGSELIVGANSAFAPFRLNPGNINIQNFLVLEERADADIDDQYDLHEVMRGKVPQGSERTSGRMVLALQDMGGTMNKPFLRKLETAMVQIAKSCLSLALRTWPREMWLRLIEDEEYSEPLREDKSYSLDQRKAIQESPIPNEGVRADVENKWKQALDKIRPADPTQPPGISMIDLDVKIAAGSSMPTNRIAKASLALDMAQAGVYDAQAVLEYIDDPYKDEIVQRLERQAAAAPQKK